MRFYATKRFGYKGGILFALSAVGERFAECAGATVGYVQKQGCSSRALNSLPFWVGHRASEVMGCETREVDFTTCSWGLAGSWLPYVACSGFAREPMARGLERLVYFLHACLECYNDQAVEYVKHIDRR